jgi:hypothetical protein
MIEVRQSQRTALDPAAFWFLPTSLRGECSIAELIYAADSALVSANNSIQRRPKALSGRETFGNAEVLTPAGSAAPSAERLHFLLTIGSFYRWGCAPAFRLDAQSQEKLVEPNGKPAAYRTVWRQSSLRFITTSA